MLTSVFPSVFNGFQGLEGVRIYLIFDEILRWRSGGSPGEVFSVFGALLDHFGGHWTRFWSLQGPLGGSIWGPVGLRLGLFGR